MGAESIQRNTVTFWCPYRFKLKTPGINILHNKFFINTATETPNTHFWDRFTFNKKKKVKSCALTWRTLPTLLVFKGSGKIDAEDGNYI